MKTVLVAVVLGSLVGCGTAEPGGMSGPTINRRVSQPQNSGLQSDDVLSRPAHGDRARVKHILIGWKDLADNYDKDIDPRAAKRSRWQAEDLVRSLMAKLDSGTPIEALMIEFSEDTGTKGGDVIEVKSDSNLVPLFIKLSLRLRLGEVGIVKTTFGWHIIRRIA